MSIEIARAKNGWVITYEDDQWVAGEIDDVKDIIEEILETIESEDD